MNNIFVCIVVPTTLYETFFYYRNAIPMFARNLATGC